ncbi:putative Aspartic endopeptidase [Taphrina deformans PYCC 5710]|uniref:Aspartic endopeptidase n=1 Tax=Taphrina deformans (strain PYCC 5710 / ATCC 11124 / CBS 356.35 / IMI 108563 / JCM 9778 / NBRC 8474) TaxID=1097556 RepID=R4XAX6_TAPDE|nr:putative Aspartic endopeptidase [Taphrina deformans PYCC 5710]|eukprot:CCG82714.1 putative Aspartic endopeptidase [Taphrina deformans PYCC 5710]
MTSRFVLHRVDNAKRTGPGLYLHALRKYNIKPTKELRPKHFQFLVQASSATRQGREPVDDFDHDVEYVGIVKVGTPPQILHLDFDTGSSDSWVNSTLQPSEQRTKHSAFDPEKSTSFKKLPDLQWKIHYGDDSTAHGVVGTDTVNLGGIEIKEQAVQLAEFASPMFVRGKDDGLLGLAWGKINTVKPTRVKTVMENMIEQGLLIEPIFAVKLVHEGPGEYTFGFVDESIVAGDIHYTKVDNSKGFWTVDSATAKINGKVIHRPLNNKAVIDTGTTLALVDDDLIEKIYATIPGSKYDAEQGGYVIPSGSTGPSIELAIGGRYFQIPRSAFSFAPLDDGSNMDFGAFQSRGDFDSDLLGDVFLKYVVAIFDQGKTRFGCARRRDVKYDSHC